MSSLLERTIEKRPDKVRFSGRILFLTEDPELIKRQLAGEDLPWIQRTHQKSQTARRHLHRRDHACTLLFYFDETLGDSLPRSEMWR